MFCPLSTGLAREAWVSSHRPRSRRGPRPAARGARWHLGFPRGPCRSPSLSTPGASAAAGRSPSSVQRRSVSAPALGFAAPQGRRTVGPPAVLLPRSTPASLCALAAPARGCFAACTSVLHAPPLLFSAGPGARSAGAFSPQPRTMPAAGLGGGLLALRSGRLLWSPGATRPLLPAPVKGERVSPAPRPQDW